MVLFQHLTISNAQSNRSSSSESIRSDSNSFPLSQQKTVYKKVHFQIHAIFYPKHSNIFKSTSCTSHSRNYHNLFQYMPRKFYWWYQDQREVRTTVIKPFMQVFCSVHTYILGLQGCLIHSFIDLPYQIIYSKNFLNKLISQCSYLNNFQVKLFKNHSSSYDLYIHRFTL